HWAGLGYYSRCRRLHATAKWATNHGWPETIDEWRKVPGVGAYTASAVGSIAQTLVSAAVDGNVARVYARVMADPATGQSLLKAPSQWSQALIPADRPGDWNQAVMELGATICKPSQPRCEVCPIQRFCRSAGTELAAKLPTKLAKPQQIELEH